MAGSFWSCEIPTRRAIVSADVPSYPRAANSTDAASSTASLRSAAVSLGTSSSQSGSRPAPRALNAAGSGSKSSCRFGQA